MRRQKRLNDQRAVKRIFSFSITCQLDFPWLSAYLFVSYLCEPAPSRDELPFGFGSVVAVPDSMVLGVEGDRPGLHRPSSPPAPRMLLREGQHVGQVFSTMDGDKCSLDPCFGTQGVRSRHGCDVVMFNMVPGSSTGTECLPIIRRTSRFEVCSCRNSLSSLARPLPRPTRRQNVAGNLVRSPLPSPLHPASTPPTLLGSAHRTPDHAPPV